ncbi:hypothetical protein ABXN37_16785 [Piscinibacter sakaiensis]|uniref:hypothetical protein n=1 Tax=Piscinibacter sakaiensis TaxID=1547922 RepID=UPI0006B69FDF|nr:hypothetical protein [Piscinibacter sakaiensis]
MTGKGPRKAVDGGHAPARLLQARPKGDRLHLLATLVQAYEARRFPIDAPDPWKPSFCGSRLM